MKNIITYLFISFLIVSCSPDDDPSIEVVPSPPSELIGELSNNTRVTLNWKDNSINETGFKIERKTGNDNYTQVGTVGSDVTTYIDNGLVGGTTYTYKVLANNSVGNSLNYTNEVVIIIYSSVIIGTQCWMLKNLDVDHYRNGDPIPQVTDQTEWASLTTGAWCYYQNITANGTVYGKLYNWYAVNDPRGLAPNGWHVATNPEWTELTTFLGGQSMAGGPMKATETWISPNTGATNSSGFAALAGGARNDQGLFISLGSWGAWWTADKDAGGIPYYRILYNNSTKSEVYHIYHVSGMAVRCVRD